MTDQTIDTASLPSYGGPDTVVVSGAGKDAIRSFDDDDGPSFSDVLDILNPLQHIPVVNTIYQALTDDKEGAVDDLMGGMLWGGPIGLGAAMVNLIVQDNTGKSISDNMLGLFDDDEAAAPQATTAATQAAPDVNAKALRQSAPDVEIMALTPVDAAGTSATASNATAATTASANAPVTAGDFLVFGAGQPAAAPQQTPRTPATAPSLPSPITPTTATTTAMPAAPTPAARAIPTAAATTPGLADAPVGNAKTNSTAFLAKATTNGPVTAGAPMTAGDFLVFGAGQPATAALPDRSMPAGPTRAPARDLPQGSAQPQTPSAAGQPSSDQAASPLPLTPANQNAIAAQTAAARTAAMNAPATRTFATPERRANLNTPQALPQPTTGPAAVPGAGAPSQALPANGAGSPWFASAFNQAMDKYDRSRALLKDGDAAPAAPVPLQ